LCVASDETYRVYVHPLSAMNPALDIPLVSKIILSLRLLPFRHRNFSAQQRPFSFRRFDQ
jgi:hypothetical protein